MSEAIETCCTNSHGKIEKELERRRSSIRPINERVAKLREESVNTEVRISSERARLITEFYKSDLAKGKSIPVQRRLPSSTSSSTVAYLLKTGSSSSGLGGALALKRFQLILKSPFTA